MDVLLNPKTIVVEITEALETAVEGCAECTLYGWKQVVPAADCYCDLDDPISYQEGTTDQNPAVELNNIQVAIGTKVSLRQFGIVDGELIWCFNAPVGSEGREGDDITGGGQCTLARIRSTDCVTISDSMGDAILTGGGPWTGTSARGDWEFGYDPAVGITYLELDGIRLMNCGNGCFTGSEFTGHLELDEADEFCHGHAFTACVSCRCCPFEGWDGVPNKWYCLEVDAECTAVLIVGDGTTHDECFDPDGEPWVYCDGPFDSEAEALVSCPVIPTAPCQGLDFTAAIATISDETGDCTCLPPTLVSHVSVGSDNSSWGTITCPGNVNWALTCSGGFYQLLVGGNAATLVSFTASPFNLVYDVTTLGANCGGGGGTARVTITGAV